MLAPPYLHAPKENFGATHVVSQLSEPIFVHKKTVTYLFKLNYYYMRLLTNASEPHYFVHSIWYKLVYISLFIHFRREAHLTLCLFETS